MSPSFRKPRPLGREEGRHRDSSIIVIACEDTYIQRAYFELFRSTRIQVRIIETPKDAGSSCPDAVLRRLCAVRDEFDWEEGKDEFWLSIDKDRWKSEVLALVYKEARQKGFNVALSNPCFEYWLLLHGIEPTAAFPNCQAAKDLLKALQRLYREDGPCGMGNHGDRPAGDSACEAVRHTSRWLAHGKWNPSLSPGGEASRTRRRCVARRAIGAGSSLTPWVR